MPYFACRVPSKLMTYTAISVIGMDIYVVEDRIVSQWEAVVLPDGNYYLPGTDEVIPADIADPPPLKWSDLRYVFDIQEDCNGKDAIQA